MLSKWISIENKMKVSSFGKRNLSADKIEIFRIRIFNIYYLVQPNYTIYFIIIIFLNIMYTFFPYQNI